MMNSTNQSVILPPTNRVNAIASELSLAQIYQRLNATPEDIIAFCQKWQLVEFALFGSILRDNFRESGAEPSDVDVLFTYGETARQNLLLLVRMQYELEELFHRPVDLVCKTALLDDPNFIRIHKILSFVRVIYTTQ
ncbi:nucleotidyltransferase family protein [Roseofilum casamattae]|uniref:Nucleotidyltransferase domain-containing protein n=1 Tax=Roseofilum casamattae BLCC-M143 TaxID=3022442 RepID=A0ABT7BSY7_9CYAN|nr:nucleotidyltransferase domain-containing protein [Roseofilum casamattae]MDJ1181897.1 nucleotidyltransferase domain-containing protein [Roseofilum casamattae BLCC-M143]